MFNEFLSFRQSNGMCGAGEEWETEKNVKQNITSSMYFSYLQEIKPYLHVFPWFDSDRKIKNERKLRKQG